MGKEWGKVRDGARSGARGGTRGGCLTKPENVEVSEKILFRNILFNCMSDTSPDQTLTYY